MLRIALVQLAVTADKKANLAHAAELIERAAANGAKIVALPECFNSPYGSKYFPTYAETVPGDSTAALAEAARKSLVYLVGGSIPELASPGANKYYNTSVVFNPQGQIIAKHRKVHLFDIDVPGGIRFQESEVLSPGSSCTHFDTEYGRFGLAICYDMRFPELAMIAQQDGCKMMFYPGAFNMTTGPLHWELLQRARAIDNQFYVAAISPARDEKGDYIAWGHSSVVDPWGKVIATTEHSEDIVYADVDFSKMDQVRQAIPVLKQKRHDLYVGPKRV